MVTIISMNGLRPESDSVADPARGIREFIVGPGGTDHTTITTVAANSEVRNANTYGVIKLTLHATSYDWQFVPGAGKTFTDLGTQACHGTGPTPTPTSTSVITNTPTPTTTGYVHGDEHLHQHAYRNISCDKHADSYTDCNEYTYTHALVARSSPFFRSRMLT